MFLTVIALLLILGIAFYQVVQGLFSAMIMMILSLLSALVAFNYYEPLAQYILTSSNFSQNPLYVYPVSLMAVFFLSLLAMRLVFDLLIVNSVDFGLWANRIGGGVMGVLSGMILVGMLTICMQMLPWDASLLGYKPYDDSLQRDSSLAPFNPDRFVLAAVDTLSAGSLNTQAGRRYSQLHPDLLLELQAQRNRCDLPTRNDTKPDTVKVLEACQPKVVPTWLDVVPLYPLLDKTDQTVPYIVRTMVSPDARDQDNWFRLPASHFRLVTDQNKSYYAIAYLTYAEKLSPDEKTKWQAHGKFKDGVAQIGATLVERPGNKAGGLVVDWVFRLPANEKPQSLVFRQFAQAKLPALKAEFPDTLGATALSRNNGRR